MKMLIVETAPGVFVRVRPEDADHYPDAKQPAATEAKPAAPAEHKARTVSSPTRSKRAKSAE